MTSGLMQYVRKSAALGLAALCALSSLAVAQDRSKHHELYMYQGPDRDQRLLEGARKEGTVVIYTSLNLKDSLPITEAFEKKYGIKVQLWRGGSEKVLNRTVTEARAGKHAVDVIETNGPEMEALYREKLLSEFYSASFRDIPKGAFAPHRHYVATRFNFFVLGYNTNLVKPEEVPNTYEDLLHPRWAGKIAIESGDSDWFAAVVKGMGEQKGLEYFRKLAAMQPQIRTGHTLIAELLAAGELPITPTVYNQNVERLALKGAPVAWKPLAPTFGRPNSISVARHAQNPHAALLFADFMLSREAQEMLKAASRVPSSRAVNTALNNFPYQTIDPVIILDESEKWNKLWSDLFHRGAAAQK